ncbi:Ig-like domain repeat protein [Bradyrhizobium mercantei]|uniref:Ig-like domain repeat protein n=1 Tax=Bradyrhizobium mercantei TaxID=1904807 RepID=UPI0013566884|nr:Ig-like domain repeat protein [Bradyrhizobium mercantei]
MPGWRQWCGRSLRTLAASMLLATLVLLGVVSPGLAASSTTTVSPPAQSAALGEAVAFTAVATDSVSTATGTITFDFGDGSPTSSQLVTSGAPAVTTHQYSAAGNYTVTASYVSDVGSNPSSGTASVTITKGTVGGITFIQVPNPSTPAQPVNVAFIVAPVAGGPQPTGTMTLDYGDGSTQTVSLSSSGTHTYATGGAYTITGTYNGDSNYNPFTATTTQSVQAPTSVTPSRSADPIFAGQTFTLSANVTSMADSPNGGTVAFDFGDGTIVNVTVSNGHAAANHVYTTSGVFTLNVSYSGTTGFAASSAGSSTETVNPAATTTGLTASTPQSTIGQPVTFTATVTASTGGTPTGTVTFNFGDGGSGTATLSGGVATINHAYTSAGSFLATASYTATSGFQASTSGNVQQTVTLPASTTTLTPSANPGNVGQAISFTAHVSGSGGTPTGTVTFNFGDGSSTTATLAAGTATASHTFAAAGNFTVTASYGGDPSFSASSATITEGISVAATTTTLTPSANPGNVGQAISFTAHVSGSGGTPTGTVTFNFGDSTTATGTLAAGTVTLSHSFAASGSFTVTASYGGNTTFGASSATLSEQVGVTATTITLSSSANPGNAGQAIGFTATVNGSGGTPTGTVTFNFGDGTSATGTLGAGTVTLNHSFAAAGSFTVMASYSGDAAFGRSTVPLVETINLNPTTLTLASSQNPSQVGQAVTFTATATSSGGTPGGTVTFKDGGSVLGTIALSGAGVATFTSSALTLGSHTITASYGGSASFAASTAPPVIQAVNTPADSLKLRAMQVLAAPVAAQNSGQAISGAVNSAISEAFSDGGSFAQPNASGIRFNFAADPEAAPEQPTGTGTSTGIAQGSGANAQAYARNSPQRIDDAFAALTTKAVKAPRQVEPRDWYAWAEVHGATLDRWGTSGVGGVGVLPGQTMLWGNQVNVLAGISRKITPNFLLGVLGGYENFDFRSDALQGRLKGDGWTIGSYLGWMISHDIRFDAAVTYSGIGYDGSAGTATGNFGGERWLASGGVTGNYRAYGFMIEPSARVYALWEHENAYTDSLGTLQTARDFATGRASGGVKVAYPIAWSPTAEFAPYAGLYGDYYFNRDNAAAPIAAPAVPTQFVLDGWSARATAGIAARFGDGAQVALGAERGGIGGQFALWTYRVRASVPFGAQ